MTKIKEVIDINKGYTSYVDLTDEFFYYNQEQNNDRMAHYAPIKAHREAFEEISKSLNPKDKRVYFLSGSYGTGKSHLCLMLGNYFLNESNRPELKKFFENYQKAQEQVKLKPGEELEETSARKLKSKRENGRYLVAICKFGSGFFHNFESTVLRAIIEALEIDEADVDLDTHYNEAVRRLNDWKKRKDDDRFYNDMLEFIKKEHSEWTFDKLIDKLEDHDEEAYKVFKSSFKKVTDTNFDYSKDNLIEILKDTLDDEKFKKAYKGLIIIYDEFGYALDDKKVDLSLFHRFTQFCANSALQHLPCAFIGTGHKPFNAHGEVGDKIHYNTLKDRVNEIPLQTEGMEKLIGSLVHQKKEKSEWQDKINAADIFSQFPRKCNELGIFDWLPSPVLKNDIIENIYPMHPYATYALIEMAKELGSENRSVFKFFSSESSSNDDWDNVQKYSYPWFAQNNEILNNKRDLNLYTADLLIDYFLIDYFERGSEAISKNLKDRIKNSILDYKETKGKLLEYSNKDDQIKFIQDQFVEKLLKVMLVNEIVSKEEVTIKNTINNIYFSLNINKENEKKRLKRHLKRLVEVGVIYLNENKIYEFRKSGVKDIHSMVNEFKTDPKNKPTDILDKFFEYVPLTKDENYLEAKNYNKIYQEDKSLKVKFVTPSMLKNKKNLLNGATDFFEHLEFKRKSIKDYTKSYEGTAIFVFCENEEDIERAKELVSKNKFERITVSIPQKPKSAMDSILDLLALEDINSSAESENFSYQENSIINDMEQNAKQKLQNIKKFYFDSKNMLWFKNQGSKMDISNRYDPADNIMYNLYKSKRNKVSHEHFNKIHMKISRTKKRMFDEAVFKLLDLSKNIQFEWNLPNNRGEKKYLQDLFVNNNFLKEINISGRFREYEVQKDKRKFKDKIPAYDEMLKNIKNLEEKGSKSCNVFFQKFYEEYGQGEIAITLITLLARRYYRDSLRFKRDKTALGDINIDSVKKIRDIVTGKYNNSVIIVEKISKIDMKYFNEISRLFSSDNIAEGRNYGIKEAYDFIKSWWENLPVLAHYENFYKKGYGEIVKLFNPLERKEPYEFIKVEIPSLFLNRKNLSKTDIKEIMERLKNFKKYAQNIEELTKKELRKKLSELFNAKGDTELDIRNAINEWYHTLGTNQKDTMNYSANSEAAVLISKIGELDRIGELFYITYPQKYGFKRVSEWQINHANEYLDKLKKAKKTVEDTRNQVGVNVKFENITSSNKDTVCYKGDLGVEVQSEDGECEIFYTVNGSDPTNENNVKRKKYNNKEKICISDGNKKLKFVREDKNGNYGNIKSYDVFDERDKVKIKYPQQSSMNPKISFIFPKNIDEAGISLNSYFGELLNLEVLTIGKLEKLLNDIIEAMKDKNDKN